MCWTHPHVLNTPTYAEHTHMCWTHPRVVNTPTCAEHTHVCWTHLPVPNNSAISSLDSSWPIFVTVCDVTGTFPPKEVKHCEATKTYCFKTSSATWYPLAGVTGGGGFVRRFRLSKPGSKFSTWSFHALYVWSSKSFICLATIKYFAFAWEIFLKISLRVQLPSHRSLFVSHKTLTWPRHVSVASETERFRPRNMGWRPHIASPTG